MITKRNHLEVGLEKYTKTVKCLESDHPTPSLTSLECGADLLNLSIQNNKMMSFYFFFLMAGLA